MHRLRATPPPSRYLPPPFPGPSLPAGQRIKNEETQQATALRRVHHQFCLLLSGTPLQNNLHEFYALLSFLLPEIFQDSDPFDHAFNLSQNKVILPTALLVRSTLQERIHRGTTCRKL